MNERALQLGPQGNLVGIWTPPEGSAHPVAVLLLNAGVIHRVGAHRTSVKLARRLAGAGYGCLRFDLGGVGDSRAARGAVDFRQQAVLDIVAAMDAIEAGQGVRSFALVGICSGAVHAQSAALADERVRGIFLIDGHMYPTWRGRAHFAGRMIRAYGLAGFGQRLLRHLRARLGRMRVAAPAPDDDGGLSRSPQDYARDMRTLTRRGVQVTLMVTGSSLEVFAYPGQLQHTFRGQPWLESVRCLFEPDVDHTLTLRSSQRLLAERVSHWLGGVAPGAPEPAGR
jgi:pimeloyl-ACP methyl ester carboxylesterase